MNTPVQLINNAEAMLDEQDRAAFANFLLGALAANVRRTVLLRCVTEAKDFARRAALIRKDSAQKSARPTEKTRAHADAGDS